VHWTIVGVIAGLFLTDLLIRLVFVPIALRIFEARPPLQAELTSPDSDGHEIRFPTTHGLSLRGSLYLREERPSRGVILFCPELSGSRWSAMSYCQGLYQAGFDILAFDFRNQGESDRQPDYEPLHWVTEYEVADVLAAIDFVRGRTELKTLPIGLFGVSRGGGAALLAAARCPDVECVACDGAFSTDRMMLHYARRWITLYVPQWLLKLMPWWHVRMTLWLVRLTSEKRRRCRYTSFDRWLPQLGGTPVFLIVGDRDNYVDPGIVGEMAQQIGPSCQSVWVVPDAKHNMARQVEPQEYDRRLMEFFSQLRQEVRRPSAKQTQR